MLGNIQKPHTSVETLPSSNWHILQLTSWPWHIVSADPCSWHDTWQSRYPVNQYWVHEGPVNGQMDKCTWRVVGKSQLWDQHYTPSVSHVTTAGRNSLQTHSQANYLTCQTRPDHCTSNKARNLAPTRISPAREARLNSVAFPVPPAPKLSDLRKSEQAVPRSARQDFWSWPLLLTSQHHLPLFSRVTPAPLR